MGIVVVNAAVLLLLVRSRWSLRCNSDVVYGTVCVVVLCTGDGAATVVALQQGAGRVVANDILPLALESTRLNIQENMGGGGEEEEEEEQRVNYISDDIVGTDVHGLFAMGGGGGGREGVDVVVAGDVLYDDDLAKAVFPWFVELASSGVEVLVGDPGRWVLQGNVVEKEGVVVVVVGGWLVVVLAFVVHVCCSCLLFTFVVCFVVWLVVGWLFEEGKYNDLIEKVAEHALDDKVVAEHHGLHTGNVWRVKGETE